MQVCGGKSPQIRWPNIGAFLPTDPRQACVILAVMDILKMLSDLRQEREQIGEAIIVLERVAARSEKRRGRPPAWMAAVKGKRKRRGRPPSSRAKS